jgi:hypothetical protein
MIIRTHALQRHFYRYVALALALLLFVQMTILRPWSNVATGDSLLTKPSLDRVRLPLYFERNVGQTDESVAFLTRSLSGTLFFRANEFVFSLPIAPAQPRAAPEYVPQQAATSQQAATLRLHFLHANPAARLVGVAKQPGTVNYLTGNDPARWHRDIPTYASIQYEQLYPGIDLRYEGITGQLKATYIVAPGANPTLIRWRYTGADTLLVDPSTGEVRITLAAPRPVTLIEQAPVAWQEIGGQRLPVDARYTTDADGSIRFALGAYDPAHPLVIDPTLAYSSYLGGNGPDYAYDIAVDVQGNFYVTGGTVSTDFPLANPVQPTPGAFGDLFVSKFNADGSTLAYSTYLGGNDSDVGFGIAVDGAGNAYVTGESWSSNFPVVNAIQPFDPGIQQDVIVFKLNPAGNSMVYSTYLGGHNSQTGWDIAVDATSNVYVTGHTISSTFPVVNAFQPQIRGIRDAFVSKINAAGSALIYSTFLGSSGDLDYGFSIAVDSAGNAYVTGQTTDDDFPTANPFQPTNGGFGDAFVSKLNASGMGLVYSTYLGGSVNEQGRSIAVDSAGNAYITGWTESANFPTANAVQPTKSGYEDVFVTKFNAAGSALVYSTFLGGSSPDGGFDSNIAVDVAGNAYVAGDAHSTDFPTINAVQPAFGGHDSDAFVAKFNAQGSALLYSTYLGGSAPGAGLGDYAYGLSLDGNGNAYVTGYTFAPDFPLAGPSFQTTNGGNYDAFVAVINDGTGPPSTPAPTQSPTQRPRSTATPSPTPTTPPAGDTGLKSPSTNAAQVKSAGDNNGFEVNASNAHADDGLFAVDNNSGTSSNTSCTASSKDKHRFYDYNFSIPSGATIQGIEVRLDAKVDSPSGSPRMCVQLSWNGGTNWTSARTTAMLTTSEATYILGSVTDLWGRTWNSGEFSNANFRVRVIDVARSTARDFSLDWVAVRVTYQ